MVVGILTPEETPFDDCPTLFHTLLVAQRIPLVQDIRERFTHPGFFRQRCAFLHQPLMQGYETELAVFLAKRVFQRGDTGEIVLTHDPIYNAAMFFLQHRQ